MIDLKKYIKYWPVVLFVGAVISAWGGMSYMLKQHDSDLKEIKNEIKDLAIVRHDLKRLSERMERYHSRERRPN